MLIARQMSPCDILRRSRKRLMLVPNVLEVWDIFILTCYQLLRFSSIWRYNPIYEFILAQKKFGELESRPHSSPDPSCGREKSRGKTKNPFPQKNRFSFCRVRIEAPRTARILGGGRKSTRLKPSHS